MWTPKNCEKWVYILRKIPENGCPFLPKWPLKMGMGSRLEWHIHCQPNLSTHGLSPITSENILTVILSGQVLTLRYLAESFLRPYVAQFAQCFDKLKLYSFEWRINSYTSFEKNETIPNYIYSTRGGTKGAREGKSPPKGFKKRKH